MSMEILSRSAALHGAAVACMKGAVPADHPRTLAAYQCALMSVEHAAGAVALLTIGMPNAAMALFRPQFESLMRCVWLLEAADERWVRQFHAADVETGDSPALADMIEALLQLEDPRSRDIVEHLDAYRLQGLGAIGVLTQGGMRPMARLGQGAANEQLEALVRCANGLVCHAAQMAALISADPSAAMQAVQSLRSAFADCLPVDCRPVDSMPSAG
ncbi:DUF6988 family protein [Cupriavidus plantarum]|uniref:DUF6988 family protein n=1 Tax=Cupriavidus plantarum TaxID=942865 RepID=UPI0015CB2BED|nr:hypothetical protein [Cupriavidus plantarum]NYI01619.1 hypothetical protein [Cupriavidus plantarum]